MWACFVVTRVAAFVQDVMVRLCFHIRIDTRVSRPRTLLDTQLSTTLRAHSNGFYFFSYSGLAALRPWIIETVGMSDYPLFFFFNHGSLVLLQQPTFVFLFRVLLTNFCLLPFRPWLSEIVCVVYDSTLVGGDELSLFSFSFALFFFLFLFFLFVFVSSVIYVYCICHFATTLALLF